MIEDDISALHTETITRSEFLARLKPLRVFVATHKPPVDGRADLLLLSVPDEEGQLLPVFTSEEYIAKTPHDTQNVLAIPFEELLVNIRPDIGIVINPDSDRSYLFRWFVLQELMDEFGRSFLRQDVTAEWLTAINERFSREGLAAERRPLEAVREWSKLNDIPVVGSAPRVKRIFDWFAANIKSDLYTIGPVTAASYFYDTVFWEVTIPLVLGAPPMNPLDMLDA